MVSLRAISLTTRIKIAIALWCVCEMIVFSIVVRWIGVTSAILLGLLSSFLGFSMLRRAGASAWSKLRTRMATRLPGVGPHLADETLATIGAVALLVPGFLSDIIGLALAVPALRDALTARIGRGGPVNGRRPQHRPTTIDLAPEEWRKGDPSGRPIPKI